MKGHLRRPSHATIVAYLALLLALGGSSYAAVKLGKNSVTAKAIKKGAVKRQKLRNDAVDSSKVQTGSLLPSDVQGGILPPGGFGSGGSQQPLTPSGNHRAVTTVTTSETSRLLVFGSAELFMTCSGAGSCSFSLGLYVDGAPVPDSGTGASAPASGNARRGLTVSGITGQLPAGSHEVVLDGLFSDNVSSSGVSQRHVAAIAVKP